MSSEIRQSYGGMKLIGTFERMRRGRRERMVNIQCGECNKLISMSLSRWTNNPPSRCGACMVHERKRQGFNRMGFRP